MSNRRRAVVTGLGIVTALGAGKDAHWQALVAGRSGVAPITLFDATPLPARIAAEVHGFNLADYVSDQTLLSQAAERRSQFGIAAAQMAVQDACLTTASLDPARCGVMFGTGLPITVFQDVCRCLDENKQFDTSRFHAMWPELHPTSLVRCPTDLVTRWLVDLYNLRGMAYTVTSACAAASQAIGLAFHAIRRGELDLALAGGADSMINPMGLLGFVLLGACSSRNDAPQEASRPFDARRDGLVVGEGGGIAILEELEHARRRGAHIYAEVSGYGASLDAYRLTAPEPNGRGAIQAMLAALQDAGWKPDEVDYINAHGTSTKLNDRIETAAVKLVFGEHAYRMAVSSNKSMFGHLIAAAGAAEFVATVQTIYNGIVPPTINYTYPDPACDLDYVPNEARRATVRRALSNSFGFGGQNSTLAVARFEE